MNLSRLTPLKIAIAFLALGCAQADENAEGRANEPRTPADVAVAPDSAPVDSADSATVDVERMLLDGACLRGNPSRGEPWFFGGISDTLGLLSVEPLRGLSSRDSSALVARIARSVNAIAFERADTSVADFRSLPVVVRDAWRVVPVAGDTTLIAIASRRLPIESNPLEEQITLLASPTHTPSVRNALEVEWYARTAGREDELEPREPVSAFTGADGLLRVVMLRETPDGPRLELLTRVDGEWRTRWEGVVPGCD